MKRLAIILPYNEEHIENFVNHFDATVDGDYKLVFMKQKSNRPLNKGKLFNIGYMLHKDSFDYFCFHDSDLIPISDECISFSIIISLIILATVIGLKCSI